MSETKFTKGPWSRNIKPASKYSVIFAGRNTHVLIVASRGLPEAEIEANCDLAAAAPEMYEACEGIVAMCETLHPIKGEPDAFIYDELGSELADAYFTARSALSKARGEG